MRTNCQIQESEILIVLSSGQFNPSFEIDPKGLLSKVGSRACCLTMPKLNTEGPGVAESSFLDYVLLHDEDLSNCFSISPVHCPPFVEISLSHLPWGTTLPTRASSLDTSRLF